MNDITNLIPSPLLVVPHQHQVPGYNLAPVQPKSLTSHMVPHQTAEGMNVELPQSVWDAVQRPHTSASVQAMSV